MIKVFDVIKAKFKLNMMSSFRSADIVDLPVIPKEKELFPNTKNDYWWGVDIGDNSSSAIYVLDSNGKFPPHIHPKNDETIIVLSEDSSLEVITNEGIYTLSTNESFTIPKGVPHAAINNKNKPITFMVVWRPKMKENIWDAIKFEE